MAASNVNTNSMRNVLMGIAGVSVAGAVICYIIDRYHIWRRQRLLQQQINQLQAEIYHLRDQVSMPRHIPSAINSLGASIERAYSDDDFQDALSEFNGEVSGKEWIPRHTNAETLLREADEWLADEASASKQLAYNRLKSCYDQMHGDCKFLWRLSKAAFQYSQSFLQSDVERRKELVLEAKTYAFEALRLDANDADSHKWCAITTGASSDFESNSEKIQNGFVFKEHIDRALELRPDDPTLHYLLGRFRFSVAKLSWLERKVATALYGAPPTATIEQALESFLTADKLGSAGWLENRLYIAKCYIALEEHSAATEWLRKATEVVAKSADDKVAFQEVAGLLSKFQQ